MRNLDTEFKGWNTTVKTGIIEGITKGTIDFAKNFGHYLAKDESEEKNGKKITSCGKLTTSQLRKFFGSLTFESPTAPASKRNGKSRIVELHERNFFKFPIIDRGTTIRNLTIDENQRSDIKADRGGL